jgi:hypothetical protein
LVDDYLKGVLSVDDYVTHHVSFWIATTRGQMNKLEEENVYVDKSCTSTFLLL